jgi:hypothetical protein
MPNQTHTWVSGNFTFKIITGNSASGISVYVKNKRIAHDRFSWGPSRCDALKRANYMNDPLYAESVMHFLFKRIDYYVDGPGLLDAWKHAKIVS